MAIILLMWDGSELFWHCLWAGEWPTLQLHPSICLLGERSGCHVVRLSTICTLHTHTHMGNVTPWTDSRATHTGTRFNLLRLVTAVVGIYQFINKHQHTIIDTSFRWLIQEVLVLSCLCGSRSSVFDLFNTCSEPPTFPFVCSLEKH